MNKHHIIFPIVLFLFPIIVSCGGTTGFKSVSSLQSELNLPKLPTQENYPESDAVILLEDNYINLQISPEYELYTIETRQVVKKLFKNIEEYASIEIQLSQGEELRSIKARTITKEGISIPLKENDFYQIIGEGEGNVFYSDTKKVRFTFPSIEKECIIEYIYVTKNDRPFFQDQWWIQGTLPIVKNRYHLELPTILLTPFIKGGLGWKWRYMAYQKSIGDPKVDYPLTAEESSRSKKVIFNWEVNNIEPVELEYAMPPFADYAAHVKFARSEWETWNDVPKNYYKQLFLPQLVIPPTVKNTAMTLTADCKSEEEKIEKLFQYVQRYRYVAIELGIGGIQPNKPETILSRQYGDCKDKSILLISLLKSIGISAQPALVKTKSSGSIDRNFPSWTFNHMITKANTSSGKVFWLDGTANYCPLGEIPYQCEGVDALVMYPDTSAALERIPSSFADHNIIDISINANLNAAAQADFNVRFIYRGEFAIHRRNRFAEQTEKEMIEYCKSLVSENYPNALVQTYSLMNLDSLNKELILEVSYAVPNAVQLQGDLNLLNIDPFQLLNDNKLLSKEKRKYPVYIGHPYTINKNIEVSFAPIYSVRNLPENVSFATEEISYIKMFEKQTNTKVSANERLVWKSTIITPNNYPEVKKLYENAKVKKDEKVILVKK